MASNGSSTRAWKWFKESFSYKISILPNRTGHRGVEKAMEIAELGSLRAYGVP
jgi:hypothetical protein